MNAMVLRQFDAPLVAEGREIPIPGQGEALVRVAACGVCGTDLKGYKGVVATIKPPRVLGHEVAGEVVSVGGGVSGELVGQRACIYLYRGCGVCAYCQSDRENMCINPGPRIGFERDGGFADYLVCAADNLIAIPDGIESDAAAVLCDAAATAARAIARADLKAGQRVAILGVGGLGSFAVQLAKRAGARVIAADVKSERLNSARDLGAEETVDLRSASLPRGLDAAIDFAGVAQSATAGFEALAPDGILVVTGYDPGAIFPVQTQTLARTQRRVAGSRGSTRSDLRMVIDLVARGELRAAIGDHFTLSQANEALARVSAGAGVGRAVICSA
ncbi:MAG TPA: alcohol dehydrogenase catalytic domain-containing protein [Candidatus Baltobacteraceae bacterium]|jgi:D-arabinose 1-dehydrogenase-like Zn-dependent alcohol dehydrogenase